MCVCVCVCVCVRACVEGVEGAIDLSGNCVAGLCFASAIYILCSFVWKH